MGFKILNFNISLGFQKNEKKFGYEDFVDIFLGSSQNWTIFKGHFYVFKGIFLRSRYRMGGGHCFWLQKFQQFFGVLEIPDIFFFWGGGG